MTKDYYEILGVDKNASSSEIKKAFRSLAQKHHPDKKTGDEKKFKEANDAYSVLSDEKKKKQYDTYGSADSNAGSGGFNSSGGFDFSGFSGGFNSGGFESSGFDFSDIFGGGFGGETQTRRGDDIAVELKIIFKESVFGTEKTFNLKKDITCKECSGSGAESSRLKTCDKCGGRGYTFQEQQTIFGLTRIQKECDKCFGDGKIPEKACKKCNGRGVINDKEEINVKIPAGVESGSRLRIKQKGQAKHGGQNGDLYIHLEVEEDKNFEKEGYDLIGSIEISVTEAVLGIIKEIKVIDGKIKVKVNAGTQHGSILKIKDQGVVLPRGGRGLLYLKVKIDIPKKIGKKEEKLFEELKDLGI